MGETRPTKADIALCKRAAMSLRREWHGHANDARALERLADRLRTVTNAPQRKLHD